MIQEGGFVKQKLSQHEWNDPANLPSGPSDAPYAKDCCDCGWHCIAGSSPESCKAQHAQHVASLAGTEPEPRMVSALRIEQTLIDLDRIWLPMSKKQVKIFPTDEVREVLKKLLEAEIAALRERPEMTFNQFSAANLERCTSPKGFNHPLLSWSLSDWFTAVVGELGEAANVAKKLNRVRDGIPGNKKTPEQLRADFADELADAFIYLDLLAQREGIVLPDAVVSKFNRTSADIGYPAWPELHALRPEPETVGKVGAGTQSE